ncbi:hypothetical protein [Amycolatopsis sp. WQ 127309]|uniref:hypothetical protein n=1 Tax=Amycolatopsis sp. WQ 127309 TaxID=2932773 RepID=UPI001FF3A844|nr:hypothetical protein [Amycolatopsis sp. WQ 127309]UOZ07374.1 hypothetical protein MUY22_03510 [Amycolatopsis sp. WQ 127309]
MHALVVHARAPRLDQPLGLLRRLVEAVAGAAGIGASTPAYPSVTSGRFLPGRENADLVARVLDTDERVRELCLASEVSRLVQWDWAMSKAVAADPVTALDPRKLAAKLAEEAVPRTPRRAGVKVGCSRRRWPADGVSCPAP